MGGRTDTRGPGAATRCAEGDGGAARCSGAWDAGVATRFETGTSAESAGDGMPLFGARRDGGGMERAGAVPVDAGGLAAGKVTGLFGAIGGVTSGVAGFASTGGAAVATEEGMLSPGFARPNSSRWRARATSSASICISVRSSVPSSSSSSQWGGGGTERTGALGAASELSSPAAVASVDPAVRLFSPATDTVYRRRSRRTSFRFIRLCRPKRRERSN